jgi:hypothetical protein
MSWFERLAQVGGKRCGKPSEQPQLAVAQGACVA